MLSVKLSISCQTTLHLNLRDVEEILCYCRSTSTYVDR